MSFNKTRIAMIQMQPCSKMTSHRWATSEMMTSRLGNKLWRISKMLWPRFHLDLIKCFWRVNEKKLRWLIRPRGKGWKNWGSRWFKMRKLRSSSTLCAFNPSIDCKSGISQGAFWCHWLLKSTLMSGSYSIFQKSNRCPAQWRIFSHTSMSTSVTILSQDMTK